MNTISGKIQNLETKSPLNDLIVVAYDYDLASMRERITNFNDSKYNLLASILPGGDTKEDPEIPHIAPGDRIGSTVTDINGLFKFSFEDYAFNSNEKELRPDLILFILAPDLALHPSSFVGTPEFSRILHMSFYPIRNAGLSESLIISISSDQLLKYNLTGYRNQTKKDEDIQTAITESYASKDQQTYSTIKVHIRENLENNKLKKDNAKSFTKNLSALPISFAKNDPLFIKKRELTSDTLDSSQRIASRQGIQKVSQQTLGNPLRKPQSFLALGEQWLDKIITDTRKTTIIPSILSGGSQNDIQIDYGVFCSMKYSKNNGTILRAKPDLLEQRIKRDAIISRLHDIENPSDPPNESDEPIKINPTQRQGTPWEPSESQEDYIKALVMAQVQELSNKNDVPIIDTENPDKISENIDHIKISLDTLMPPSGPAEVTSFYEINTLQIAYPNVWTEAFDGNVEQLMEDMHLTYEEAYEVYKEEGPPSDILDRLALWNDEELHDLESYTNIFGQLSDDIKAFGPLNIPGNVKNSFGGGDITFADEYSNLSVSQQTELLELATEYQEILSHQAPPEQQANDDFGASEFLRSKVFSVTNLGDLGEPGKISAWFDLFKSTKEEKKDIGLDWESEKQNQLAQLRSKAGAILGNPTGSATKAQRIMAELAERLKHPHSFKIYPENSYNFGIVTSTMQQWVKGPYQAKNLVSSLTLAPGQKQSYTKSQVLKKSSARKEAENNSSTLSDERTFSAKATSDVMDKISKNTNFAVSHNSEGSGGISGIFNIKAQTGLDFKKDQSAEYQKNLNSVKEATKKAAQEYKNEWSLEVSTEYNMESNISITSEISNPNNEITVTYLFYELERQYRVSEHLNKVTPVILVAQHVPAPHEIDEDWMLGYEWILRRNILDISFLDALDFVSEGLIGDEVSLEVLRENHGIQKELVEELSTTVSTLTQMQESLRDTLIQTSEQQKLAVVAKERRKKKRRRGILKRIFNPIGAIADKIASGRSNLSLGNEDPEMLEARKEALETRLEYLDSNMDNAQGQLMTANSVLTKVSQDLEAAIKDSFTKKTLVTQLKIHIKENILYYMQAIWSYEYEHQRYMRLYNLPVKVPMPGLEPADGDTVSASIDISPIPENVRDGLYGSAGLGGRSNELVGITLNWPIDTNGNAVYHEVEKRLHEIADVDNMLGFKGNYMMFPLTECTFITDYMMQDYVNEYLGAGAPDPLTEYSTEKLLKLAEKVFHDEATTSAQREALTQLITERLTSSRLDDELIVLPTGQLFIEALKGSHPLLEDFKIKHRKMDMLKVKEEVRSSQLENLRKALRLVNDDDALLNDPDIDKKVVVQGSANVNVTD